MPGGTDEVEYLRTTIIIIMPTVKMNQQSRMSHRGKKSEISRKKDRAAKMFPTLTHSLASGLESPMILATKMETKVNAMARTNGESKRGKDAGVWVLA